jgi:hypothetical protein
VGFLGGEILKSDINSCAILKLFHFAKLIGQNEYKRMTDFRGLPSEAGKIILLRRQSIWALYGISLFLLTEIVIGAEMGVILHSDRGEAFDEENLVTFLFINF